MRRQRSSSLTALLLALTLGSGALASSPAQEVFDETTYFLLTQYGGFSVVNLRELPPKYQPQLDAACMDRANTCPAEIAYLIVVAMVREVADEHTNFYPKGAAELREVFSGTAQTKGFGLRPARLETGFYVRGVQVDSPAAKAGVQRGDRLVAVDGAPLPKSSDADAFYKIWDAAQNRDAPTLLSLTRAGGRVSVTVKPERLPAELPSLELRPDRVAVMRVPDFVGTGPGSVGGKIHALTLEAIKRGAKAVIVDLRDNPGGLITECFSGVGAFAPNDLFQKLVTRDSIRDVALRYDAGAVIQSALGVERTLFTVNPVAKWDGKAAVLINKFSASCAEFFSLNFLRAKRGPVIGEPTYGVGNTATAFNFLSDGSALQVTVSRSLQPDGRPYPDRVTPTDAAPDDLEAIGKTGVDAVLEKALELLK